METEKKNVVAEIFFIAMIIHDEFISPAASGHSIGKVNRRFTSLTPSTNIQILPSFL
jgi:hypothetical protein